MTLPRTILQQDLHALLCLRHTKDARLRPIVRQFIREDLQRLKAARPSPAHLSAGAA